MKCLLALTVLIAIAAHATALKCYSCDYESEKACKGEDPELGEIIKIDDPDEDFAEYCVKFSFDNGKKGQRSYVDKDGLDTLEDAYDVKNGNCEANNDYAYDGDTYDDMEVCVCDSNLCNGSGVLAVSMTTLLLAAIAKYIC